MGVQVFPVVKSVVAVDARPLQDIEGTAEGVLVNARGTVHPVVHINVESGAVVNGNGWLPKTPGRIVLIRRLGGGEKPTNDIPRIQVISGCDVAQNLDGNIRKHVVTVVGRAPTAFDFVTHLLKQSHSGLLQDVI